METIFWLIFLISLSVQLVLWLGLWYPFASRTEKETPKRQGSSFPKVSIIVPFKNEEKNLTKNLPYLINQDYPDFEIVLINDHSEDQSLSIAQSFCKQNSQFLCDSLTTSAGKKSALTHGIGLAQGEWIALTDADCQPSPRWLKTMIRAGQGADIILGYGPYQEQKGLLNQMIRYETWYIALQYMAALKYRLYYMAVGRNMLIKKKSFVNANGFKNHMNLISGSDDLFMNALQKEEHIVAHSVHPDSYVYSSPKESLNGWFKQKKRHISTSVEYKFRIKLLMLITASSHLFLYLSALFLLINGSFVTSIIALLSFRGVVLVLCSFVGMKKIKERDLFFISPLLDILLALFYFSLSFTLFFKQKKW